MSKLSLDDLPPDISGADVDAWGGGVTNPSFVPRPYTQDPCVCKIDGRCACEPGAELCVMFELACGTPPRRSEHEGA